MKTAKWRAPHSIAAPMPNTTDPIAIIRVRPYLSANTPANKELRDPVKRIEETTTPCMVDDSSPIDTLKANIVVTGPIVPVSILTKDSL
jgi:hypothetical protein